MSEPEKLTLTSFTDWLYWAKPMCEFRRYKLGNLFLLNFDVPWDVELAREKDTDKALEKIAFTYLVKVPYK